MPNLPESLRLKYLRLGLDLDVMASIEPARRYSLTEVADLIGCNRSTVWRVVSSGELSSVRLRHSYYILGSSLTDFLSARAAAHLSTLGLI